ncbi:hypothetical protein AAY81_02685 [Denitrobacterium detoxificans]|uniref:DUF559 domain-containing protein n=1 Tax=Denitrobacterium detoxificans TaxID=79604 RepID=A0A172RWX4_9ACTN|nr:hypothetical protein [Denitrobacterium detoxificans]ANE22228.1 hypothetical protein AAY81_02685 [Denitrobacterium detoxificans]SEO64556.1 hypothetical protein SAMN02910314_00779 [Denitrobacterium detoxificans]
MERLFISHNSAFWIWRKLGHLAPIVLVPARVHSLAYSSPSQKLLMQFEKEHPDLALNKLDIMVTFKQRKHLANAIEHVCDRQLPERSFYQLEENFFIASPELCLIQLASKTTTAKAVKLAMEMCGSYAIGNIDELGFCKRPPITSVDKIEAYAERLFKPNTRAKTVQFLKWTVDNAASPRETALCMLLCMPPRFGGYGIPLPQLNKRIELSLKEQLAVGRRYFDCDLYWQGKRVGMEYDSARFHTASEKQEQDAVRRNMLQHKNIHMITATRLQVNQEGAFDELAHQVARALGKRMPTPKREHIAERRSLRDTLFNWDIFPRVNNEEQGE